MALDSLKAWHLAMDLVRAIYRVTASFPKKEQYGLTSQIRRAAVSIPSNIAEGHARHTRREFARFVSHAQGSTAELTTQLRIAADLGYLTTDARLADALDHLARSLNNLRRSLQSRERISNLESRISYGNNR